MLYESQNTSKNRIKKIFAVVSLIVVSSLLASCRLRENSLSQPTPNRDSDTSRTNRSTISPRSSSTQTAFPNLNGDRRQNRDNNRDNNNRDNNNRDNNNRNNNSRQDNNRQDNRGSNNTERNRNGRNNRSHPCRL